MTQEIYCVRHVQALGNQEPWHIKYGPSGYAEDAGSCEEETDQLCYCEGFLQIFQRSYRTGKIHRADISFYGCAFYCYQ